MKKLATATASLLLVQALGLQVLCFCGACPLSTALGVVAVAEAVEPAGPAASHACCHGQDTADTPAAPAPERSQVAGVHDCCAADHALASLDMSLPERPAALDLQPDPIVADLGLPALFGPHRVVEVVASRSARGPPAIGRVPLYLLQSALLI